MFSMMARVYVCNGFFTFTYGISVSFLWDLFSFRWLRYPYPRASVFITMACVLLYYGFCFIFEGLSILTDGCGISGEGFCVIGDGLSEILFRISSFVTWVN